MKASTLFAVLMLALRLPVAGAAQTTSPTPPAGFLQTEASLWQRTLSLPITANFDHARLGKVVRTLEKQCRAAGFGSGLTYSPEHKGSPSVTRKFVRVPLRDVLYQVSQDTGFSIDIVTLEHTPRAILIRNY